MIAAAPPPALAPPAFAVTAARVSPARAFFDARPVGIRVRFRSAAPVTVRVQITTRRGKLVRRFDVRGAVAPGPVGVRWNGLTTHGFAAPGDRYRVSAGQAGAKLKRIGSVLLRDHLYPVRGSHYFRGGIGLFGAPRTGGRRHEGFDINSRCGAPVVAARGGAVTTRRYDPVLYGNVVIVHGSHERVDYWYAHLRSPARVERGQRIRTGQRIGDVGATGNARTIGCHLHFETHGPGGPFDPLPSLRAWDGWS